MAQILLQPASERDEAGTPFYSGALRGWKGILFFRSAFQTRWPRQAQLN